MKTVSVRNIRLQEQHSLLHCYFSIHPELQTEEESLKKCAYVSEVASSTLVCTILALYLIRRIRSGVPCPSYQLVLRSPVCVFLLFVLTARVYNLCVGLHWTHTLASYAGFHSAHQFDVYRLRRGSLVIDGSHT